MEDPACIAVQHRILWKCSENLTTTKYANIASREEISQRFKIRPPRRTLFHLCSNAVVVVQEFALTCFLLARHHIALFYNQNTASPQQHVYLELSTAAIVLALLTAVVFSARADQSQQQDRKTKIIQRSSDAILLGLLLRWMAGILQSLTASYSSDTVQALALAGMTIHLLFCDYSYANGRDTASTTTTTPSVTQRDNENARPPFLGGIYSLNAALFSTTLLVSRFPDSLSAYLFLTLSILIFAHYPATRHAISASHPALYSVATWLVTACICASTVLQLMVLDDASALCFFLMVTSALGFIFPLWKYVAQHFKVSFRGPWDIPTTASMQLDWSYQNQQQSSKQKSA